MAIQSSNAEGFALARVLSEEMRMNTRPSWLRASHLVIKAALFAEAALAAPRNLREPRPRERCRCHSEPHIHLIPGARSDPERAT